MRYSPYLQVMLDVDGDGKITFDELIVNVQECQAAGVRMEASRDSVEVPDMMLKLHTFMALNGVDSRRVFEACDLDVSG